MAKRKAPVVNGNPTTADGMDFLASILRPSINRTMRDDIRDLVREILPELAPRVVEVRRPDAPMVKLERSHFLLEEVLRMMGRREWPYLHGEPGAGKTTLAAQCAEALGLEYGYLALNPQSPESRILGLMDAHGKYHPTLFRKLYEHGGVMLVDELDNASPSLLAMLNGLLDNGVGAFPDGMIKRHKDFIFVATGNTNGKGATRRFPDRRALDGAFLDRLMYVPVPYDEKLEDALAASVGSRAPDKTAAWVKLVRDIRAFVLKEDFQLIVSPRASILGARAIADGVSARDMLERCVFRGCGEDIRAAIYEAVKIPRELRSKEEADEPDEIEGLPPAEYRAICEDAESSAEKEKLKAVALEVWRRTKAKVRSWDSLKEKDIIGLAVYCTAKTEGHNYGVNEPIIIEVSSGRNTATGLGAYLNWKEGNYMPSPVGRPTITRPLVFGQFREAVRSLARYESAVERLHTLLFKE